MDATLDLFDEEVAKDVAAPLLTKSAVTLLQYCLSSRENHIWASCGDYWRLPMWVVVLWCSLVTVSTFALLRNEFEGDPVPYRPLFLDGWSPGYISFQEEEEERLQRQGSRGSRGSRMSNKVGTNLGI